MGLQDRRSPLLVVAVPHRSPNRAAVAARAALPRRPLSQMRLQLDRQRKRSVSGVRLGGGASDGVRVLDRFWPRRALSWIGAATTALVALLWLQSVVLYGTVSDRRCFVISTSAGVLRLLWVPSDVWLHHSPFPSKAVDVRHRPLKHRWCLPRADRVLGAWIITVPLWLLFSAVAIPTVALWRVPRRGEQGRCRECDYDLTGNLSGRCPECGTAVASTGEPR